MSIQALYLIAALAGGLLLTLAGSELLVRGLHRLSLNLRLTASLLGLLTAFGADAPEIFSALSAMRSQAVDVGVGVIVGSNLFNLAGLLGLSALLRGRIDLRRRETVIQVALGVLILVVSMLMLSGLVRSRLLGALVIALLALNVLVVGEEAEQHIDSRSWRPVLAAVPALAALVAGSLLMVWAVLGVARTFSLPRATLGVAVLAVITSIPNAYAAVRLAFDGKGDAVLSETMNSNNINLAFGVALPALLLGMSLSAPALGITALLGLTLIATVPAIALGRVGRPFGAVVVLGYLVSIAAIIITKGA